MTIRRRPAASIAACLLAAGALLLALAACSSGAREQAQPPPATSAPATSAAPSAPPPAAPATVAPQAAAATPPPLPPGAFPVVFDPAFVDFGVLPPGGKGETVAKLWNLGTAPVTVARSGTSCGCTVADDLSGRVLEPGQAVDVHAVMNLKSGLGEKREQVVVVLQGEARVTLALRAEAALPVRVTPPYADASTGAVTGTVVVESRDGRPFRVIRSGGGPADLVTPDAPAVRHEVRWDLAKLSSGSVVPWFWVLETDHPDAPVVDVRVRHATTLPQQVPGRPWVPHDQRVLAGVVKAGVPFEIAAAIEHLPGRTPTGAVDAASGSPFLTAKLLDSQVEGAVTHVKVEVTAQGAPGLLYGTVLLRADGFDAPLLVIGRIE